jgi:hypothetical protein
MHHDLLHHRTDGATGMTGAILFASMSVIRHRTIRTPPSCTATAGVVIQLMGGPVGITPRMAHHEE